MENTELIKVLRCELYGDDECDKSDCPIWSELGCRNGIANRTAADALEADEKRIADQQKQIAKLSTLLDNKIEELEAQFLKEGEWKWNSLLNEYEWVDNTFYCPNCGAKMKRGEDK